MRGAERRVRCDFLHGKERPTPAPKMGRPSHGHDPPEDRLAACPSEPQLSVVRERHAEYRCLVAGQENERGAPNSIKQLRDRVFRGGERRRASTSGCWPFLFLHRTAEIKIRMRRFYREINHTGT